MDIIGHSPQYCIHDLFCRVAANRTIPMDFLNPFEVDNRDDAYLQVWILGDVHLVRLDRAVQAFIKKRSLFSGKASQSVNVPAA